MTDDFQYRQRIVKPERTGQRDLRFSERHRKYGFDFPAVDIDLILLEFDSSKPVAIIEVKQEHEKSSTSSHPSYKALAELGRLAGLPVFAVRHASDFSWFRVTGLNVYAKKYLPAQTVLNELEFVDLLYVLRGRKMPKELRMELEGVK